MLINNFNQTGFGREQFNNEGVQKPTDAYMLQVLQMQELEAVHNRVIKFNFEFDRIQCNWCLGVLEKIEELDDLERSLSLRPDKYKPEKITLEIGSYGGSVLDAFQMWDKVEQLKEKGYIIETVTHTYAISCGSISFITGSIGHRKIGRHARVLIHQVSSGCGGTYEDMQREVEFTKQLWEELKELILKNTKVTEERLQEIQEKKIDWWIDAKTAVKLGIADEII